jgi:O-antigen/teichoic acid export membrane protein
MSRPWPDRDDPSPREEPAGARRERRQRPEPPGRWRRPWPEQDDPSPREQPRARRSGPRHGAQWTGEIRIPRPGTDHSGPMPRSERALATRPARTRQRPPRSGTLPPPRLRERAFGPPTGEMPVLRPGLTDYETGQFRRVVLEPPRPSKPSDDGYEYPEIASGSSATVGGLGWQSLAAVISQASQGVVMMIVAANVLPAEYALIGISSVLFSAMFLTNTMGLGTALVHFDDRRRFRAALDGAAWLNLGMGVSLTLLTFLTAPLLANLFQEGFQRAEVINVIQVMSLMFLTAAAIEIPQGIIEKTRDFKKRAIPEITGSLAFAAFALSMLYLGYGVWGSIWGRVLQFGILAVGVQLLTPMRPRLRLRMDWAVVRKLLGYGKFIGLATIVMFALNQAGGVSVGSLAGADALGAYALAFTLVNVVPTFLGQTLGKVFFPLYASVRHSNERLMAAYDNAGHFTGVVMFPVTGLLLTVGPDALVYVFGEAWEPAGTLIRVLAVWGLCRAVSNANVQLLNATGRPNLTLWNSVVALVVPLVLLWPASAYGAVGIAVAFTVGQVLSMVVTTVSTIAYTTIRLVRYLLAPATATAAAALEALAVSQILQGRATGIAAGVIEVSTFGVTYLVGLGTLDYRMRSVALRFLRRARAQPA